MKNYLSVLRGDDSCAAEHVVFDDAYVSSREAAYAEALETSRRFGLSTEPRIWNPRIIIYCGAAWERRSHCTVAIAGRDFFPIPEDTPALFHFTHLGFIVDLVKPRREPASRDFVLSPERKAEPLADDPLIVDCPRCGAPIARPCRSASRDRQFSGTHAERRMKALAACIEIAGWQP